MSLIADTLRECAYRLPIRENSKEALFGGFVVGSTSPFICDQLFYMPCGIAATLFLRELGMGQGTNVFFFDETSMWSSSPDAFYEEKHQILRAWWLLFAADLAEEWGV